MELHNEVDVENESEGRLWQLCSRRPILALLLTLLGIVTFWTPFYFAAPILPIKLETDFEEYLSSDEPAFVEYRKLKDLSEELESNAFSVDEPAVAERYIWKRQGKRLLQDAEGEVPPQQVLFLDTLEIIYLCTSENCESIYTPEALTAIKRFETKMKNTIYKPGHCAWKVTNEEECELPTSVINFFFPSPRPGSNSYVLDGEGENLVDIDSAIRRIKQEAPEVGQLLFSRGTFADNVDVATRSRFRFVLPAGGFREFAKDELYPFLVENEDLGPVRVLWYNTVLNEVEIENVVYSDLRFAIGSVVVVFAVMCFHSGSFFLTFIAMLSIILCYPATYVIYRFFFGIEEMMVFNFSSVFVLVGIGADDFFIFSDLWSQSRHLNGFSMSQRLSWTFRKAAGATMVTTFTTAASFFANLSSPIEPIRSFGTFMGVIVLMLYLHIVLCLPPALIIHDRYFLNKCCSTSSLGSMTVTKKAAAGEDGKPPTPSEKARSWLPKSFALGKASSHRSADTNASSEVSARTNEAEVVGDDDVQLDVVEAQTVQESEDENGDGDENNQERYPVAQQSSNRSLGRVKLLKQTSSSLFGSMRNIRTDMEEDAQEISAGYSGLVLFFYNKVGTFVYRYRIPLVVSVLALFIGMLIPLINQAEMSKSIPAIFSNDTNIGMILNVRRASFNSFGDIPADLVAGDSEAQVCLGPDGETVLCTAAPTQSPTIFVPPTRFPTRAPTPPTGSPTKKPTLPPVTPLPTLSPTKRPTRAPVTPTQKPTRAPTNPIAVPVPEPTPPPTDPQTLAPTISPTRGTEAPTLPPLSPVLSQVTILGNGQAFQLSPPFNPDAFTYDVVTGPLSASDLTFRGIAQDSRAQVIVDVLTEEFAQVYVSSAPFDRRYNFTIITSKPLACECNGNGICHPDATKENPFCKCYAGYTQESNCAEVTDDIKALSDSDVAKVRVTWLRSAGFESFVDLQVAIVDLCDKLDNFTKAFENPLEVRKVSQCLIRDLIIPRVGKEFEGIPITFPMEVTEEEFAYFFRLYISRFDPNARDVILFNENGRVEALSIDVITNIDGFAGVQDADGFYQKWEAFIKQQDPRLIQTSFLWARTQTELAVVRGTTTSALVSILCAFFAILLFTKFNLIVTMITTLSIVIVVLLLLSTMVVIFGRDIGAIESLSCIVLIGLAVDYSVHLAHTFEHSHCNTLEARARHALGQTGVSILFGAITTCGAAILLLFSSIVLFRDFGTFVLFNTFFSLFVSIFFLVPALVLGYNAWNFIRFRGEEFIERHRNRTNTTNTV